MACEERENYLKFCRLVVNETQHSLVDLLNLHLSIKTISFEDFIYQHQHDIFHLYINTKCCKCTKEYIKPKHRVLYEEQLSILFDRSSVKSCQSPSKKSGFCCCKVRSKVQTNFLDVTLAATLLVNFCHDVFWYSCLDCQSLSLKDFLNQNKHQIYHLMEGDSPCCECPRGYIMPVNQQRLGLHEWKTMFNLAEFPCMLHRMVPSDLICTVSASPDIKIGALCESLSKFILEECCSLRKTVGSLVKLRNSVYAHARNDKLTYLDYIKYRNETEAGIIAIAGVCNNEITTKYRLVASERRPLDGTSSGSYQTTAEALNSMQNNLDKTCMKIKDVIQEQLTSTQSNETNTNSPTAAENTLQINEELCNTVTLIEDLASANESSSKTKKALKTAFEFLSVIKVIDKNLSAVVETAEKIYKMRHDKKLDDILKSIESKIDEELTIKFKEAKTFFVRKISFLSGLSIHKINKNDTVFINQNVEPFKNLEFMTEVLERINKEKKLGKRRNFSKLMKYIQEYIILSVLRAITFRLYLRILDESPNFNITGGVVAIDNDQTEDDSSLLQFLVQPSQDTLVYNFMYNPTNYQLVDTLIRFYFPDQGKQLNSLEYLCNGKYVIKSVKYNGAFLYMVNIPGTWLRWQKQETDQSTFTFSKTDIDGKTYFKIRSSKWKGYCAIMGGLNIWARGIGSGSDNEGLFEIIKFKKNEDSQEDLYSFSPKDSKATFLIANESGRVSGRQCPPCPETFFKIERRNSLTT